MTDLVTRGDLSEAVETFFDRVRDYIPPPVFVGRTRAMTMSVIASLVILVVSLRPALQLKRDASNSMEEMVAIGIIVGCVGVALIMQRVVSGTVYTMAMNGANRQHLANAHWLSHYARAQSASVL